MIKSYADIQKGLTTEENCRLIPDGLMISEPILGKEKSLPVVNYLVATKSQQGYHLLYKFSLSIDENKLLTFSKYTDDAYIDKDDVIGLTVEEFNQYKKLFEETENMYYDQIPLEPEKICRYMQLLLKLIPYSLLNYYNDLSPEFFGWARDVINGI